MSELCDKAEEELKDELRGAEWSSVKKLDASPGAIDSYARHTLKALLDPIRARGSSSYHSEASVGEMSAAVVEAKSSVATWPDGYGKLLRRSGLDARGLLSASELKVPNAGLGAGGAGAVCLVLRASKRRRSVRGRSAADGAAEQAHGVAQINVDAVAVDHRLDHLDIALLAVRVELEERVALLVRAEDPQIFDSLYLNI